MELQILPYITNVGSMFLFQTNKDASNWKLITVNINLHCQPSSKENKDTTKKGCSDPVSLIGTFVEENKTKVIDWTEPFDNDKLIICYLEDVKHKLEIRSLRDGSLLQGLELQVGTISDFHVENKTSNEFFFKLKSFILPGSIYHCKSSGKVTCEIIKNIQAGSTDLTKIITEQIFYPSKDGTRVPMYIVRHQDVPLDGTAPTILYGYGGYNINLMPSFSIATIFFVEHFRGIYASANIRGGGEYGEKWHVGGMLLNKQNVFDDFEAAAEFLIKTNYTKSSKLTITGASNGGLLVGACVNQRPDLYGAAIAQVGVMDMLRFQKFTIGYTWCPEFGCSDDKAYFENLLKYSPLHNIRVPANASVQYPAVLVTTADHDDRVVPSHSFKYIAELQHTIGSSSKQTNPLLLRVETKAGHGGGKPTSKMIDEKTDIYSFIAQNLGLEFKISRN
ncbi:unnamed protein product [Allacma fusca]|uniref:Prolyl endopeptidase n=1 Tax=Allacma fusca TaxID=39272 RepID=A0A8J2NW81_9HEXA|nr:unnamed protein product [Allacma fusca]